MKINRPEECKKSINIGVPSNTGYVLPSNFNLQGVVLPVPTKFSVTVLDAERRHSYQLLHFLFSILSEPTHLNNKHTQTSQNEAPKHALMDGS